MAEQKFVIVSLGSEHYGLPIADVKRILAARASDRVLVGGQYCPVYDLGLRLGRDASRAGQDVIVRSIHGDFALRVDEVIGMASLPASHPTAPIHGDALFTALAQGGEATFVVLNLDGIAEPVLTA